nr:MAG TPA: hypothetical protein [Caudoviricetes sp.]
MKKLFRKWRERRLRKWAMTKALRVPGLIEDQYKVAQEIYDWIKDGRKPQSSGQ